MLTEQLNLTDRQKRIIKLCYTGMTYREIGYRLHYSTRTITRDVSYLFLQAGVSKKSDLLHWLNENGKFTTLK